jgi:phage FluMu protein Com
MKAKESSINNSVSLLTKHGKQNIIAPIFSHAFSTTIVHTDKFDTDSLGSFDHKILRRLSPVECALKKAYLSCELSDCQQGLGSEGIINSMFGIGVVDEEFIAFVDTVNKIEIIAYAKKAITLNLIEAKYPEDLARQLSDFTSQSDNKQKWLLQQGNDWIKGLSSNELLSHISYWPAKIEPDFRAMNCPQRQEVIALATHDLVQRLTAHCPKCKMINFVPKTKSEGLEYLSCELCSLPTTKSLAPTRCCDQCGFTEKNTHESIAASAFYCSFCNP